MVVKRTARRTAVTFSSSVLLALGAQGGPVSAADGAESAAESDSPRLEEVVVTAQKRTEILQDVPVSVQVISAQELAQQNQNSLSDLAQVLPGVHVESGGFSNRIVIRGVGTGDNASFDQSVSTFVDDIYHGRSKLSNAVFLDLERIEVLKGPQSTFFGNNAIAGAFNVVTRKPGDQFDGWARALYGQFGQYAIEGAGGGPLTDNFRARVAISRNGTTEGYIDNVTTDESAPRVNNVAGRVTFVYLPFDSLEAVLKVESSRHHAAGTWADQPLQWANCPPPAPVPAGFNLPCNAVLARGAPVGLDTRKTEGIPGQNKDLETFESVLTFNYSLGEHTLTSVSGYHDFDSEYHAALIPEPVLTFATLVVPEKYHQFSQELRLTSPADGHFEYLAGAYFQTDRLNWQVAGSFPLLNGVASLPPFAGLAPFLPVAPGNAFTVDEDIYSVFGSLGWNVTERLKLNAGLRGSRVDKTFAGSTSYSQALGDFGPFVPLPTTPGSCSYPDGCQALWGLIIASPPGSSPDAKRSDDAWMPSAGLQFRVNPEAMLYASYTRGFLAGGFDGGQLVKQVSEFDPEHVNAYEVGMKTQWLDGRALLNVSVFRSDYKDLQLLAQVFNTALGVYEARTTNAASSRSKGVELEAEWAPASAIRLGSNVTYLDSRYVSFPNAPTTKLQDFCGSGTNYADNPTTCSRFPNPVPGFRDASGDRTMYAPKWSGSVYATFAQPIGGNYRLTVAPSAYYSSSYNEDPDQFFDLGTRSYVRFDGQVSFQSSEDTWSFDLIGKNLTDRTIIMNSGSDLYLRSNQQRRNVALQLRYHW